MKRLLYISTTRTPLDDTTLESILTASRRNNARVGVTGMLVAGGRRFLQALEGEESAVDTVYARIARDERHHAIVLLSQDRIETRSFEAWSMGYRRAGPTTVSNDLHATVSQLTASITDANLRAYFTSFAQLHTAA
ncbi:MULTISPECIES: BLUF domain-containing protein [unclassified Sphingomonas]|uniref:BLUF domain-containing protein n=1 Tax=unclassified Sphingomonas TaxID=196159 RepID=UPI001F575559|nr:MULTISPECIES: BLUF domain-containing protein [unclassified Sphingomonas]